VAPGERGIAEVAFAKLLDPEAVLAALVGLVRAARTRPLPLVYETARDYADCAFGAALPDAEQGLRRAASSFKGRFGAAENPYVKLFYPSFESLLQVEGPLSFTALARLLFEPFFRDRTAP
jgi:exonuclease V gamma subunit